MTFVSAPLVDTYVCHESVNRATGEEESTTHRLLQLTESVKSALGRGRVFIYQPNTKSDQGEICQPNHSILE